MSTRWRKYWLLVFLAADIRLARTNPFPRIDRFFLVLLLVFGILVLGVESSSTDQRVTKLARGKHCPLCKMRGPRWETCGGREGAVVSWFFDDQFVNGCRTERRRSLLLFFLFSRSIHHEALRQKRRWAVMVAWTNHPIVTAIVCPIVAQNRRNEVSAVMHARGAFMQKQYTTVSWGTRANTTVPSSCEPVDPTFFYSVLLAGWEPNLFRELRGRRRRRRYWVRLVIPYAIYRHVILRDVRRDF